MNAVRVRREERLMRWHVHGKDAVTGADIELVITEAEAELAVKAAIDRQIVVSHVTADRAQSLRRFAKPLLSLAVVGLLVGAYWLVSTNTSLRHVNASLNEQLDDASISRKHMASSLAAAEQAAANIRASGRPGDGNSDQIKRLQEDLAMARSRMSLTEQQLSVTHEKRDDLEAAAARLPEAESQLAMITEQFVAMQASLKESEKQVTKLRGEVAAKEKSLEEATGDLEKLKAELLLAIAKANMPVLAERAETAPAVTMPWALRVSYDTARSFIALHTDPRSISTKPGGLPGAAGERVETTAGVLTDNAVRMRLVHDKEKGHVYAATMILSVAADAPREKAAENGVMMGEFLEEFVPGIENAAGIVTAAVSQAPSLTEDRRALFLTQDCRVMAWVNKEGLLTLQVEAAKDAE